MHASTFLSTALLLASGVSAVALPALEQRADVTSQQEILNSINYMRGAYGAGLVQWDNALFENAKKSGQQNGGKASRSSVTAPSKSEDTVPGIEKSDVCDRDTGGHSAFGLTLFAWLCTDSDAWQVKSQCAFIQKATGINSFGGGSHLSADIITNKSYTKVACVFTRDTSAQACALWTGIWTCDWA